MVPVRFTASPAAERQVPPGQAVSSASATAAARCSRSATLLTREGETCSAPPVRARVSTGSGAVVFLADDPTSGFVGGAPEIASYLGSWLLSALSPARPEERVRVTGPGDGTGVRRRLRIGQRDGPGAARGLFRHRDTVLNPL
jgi:hypothetical protein